MKNIRIEQMALKIQPIVWQGEKIKKSILLYQCFQIKVSKVDDQLYSTSYIVEVVIVVDKVVGDVTVSVPHVVVTTEEFNEHEYKGLYKLSNVAVINR